MKNSGNDKMNLLKISNPLRSSYLYYLVSIITTMFEVSNVFQELNHL